MSYQRVSFLLLLSVAASVPASVAVRPPIAEGRTFPVNGLPPLTYSPKHYTFYIESSTFFQAWQSCISKGLQLASIENYQDHMAYVKALSPIEDLNGLEFWLAGTNLGAKADEYDKHYWITNDRPVGYLSGFENWISGDTVGIPYQCIATYTASATWTYGFCGLTKPAYACEEPQQV